MSYKIIWDKKARDKLEKLETPFAQRIILKVRELSENPFSKDIKKLQGENSFRLRVGDYRVIFDIIRDAIIILNVGHRKNIYGK
jgi:mRNA interferase RelE/StbE